eukprot:5893966-Amphidinium_carterae.2
MQSKFSHRASSLLEHGFGIFVRSSSDVTITNAVACKVLSIQGAVLDSGHMCLWQFVVVVCCCCCCSAADAVVAAECARCCGEIDLTKCQAAARGFKFSSDWTQRGIRNQSYTNFEKYGLAQTGRPGPNPRTVSILQMYPGVTR